jgi:hypothetical protein
LRREAPSVDRVDLDAVFVRLSGEEGLTERHNTFARRHALAKIAGALPDGMAAAELEAVTDRYLADPQVVRLGGDGDPRYTTVGLLACEKRMIDGAERRTRERTAVLTPFFVDRVVQQHEPSLNEEQATVVRAIACSGRGIDAVQALAGTGKTTMLAAVADCYREARYRVIGAAPTARAARQLRESAGIPATTMHPLLGAVEQADGLAGRTVLLIDEAGMAPTRLTAALLAHAERAGAKVIAVGVGAAMCDPPARSGRTRGARGATRWRARALPRPQAGRYHRVRQRARRCRSTTGPVACRTCGRTAQLPSR